MGQTKTYSTVNDFARVLARILNLDICVIVNENRQPFGELAVESNGFVLGTLHYAWVIDKPGITLRREKGDLLDSMPYSSIVRLYDCLGHVLD